MLGHIYLFIIKVVQKKPLYASVLGIYANTPYRSIGVAVSAYQPRRYTVSACRPYTVDVYLFIYLSSVGWLGFVVDIGRFWATVCETVVRPILSDR